MNKLFIFGMMIIAMSGLAVALDPGVPHQFYGDVTTNGQAAADGLLVVAQIDGADVASTTTKDGSYGMGEDIFYVPDEKAQRSGETVMLFVVDRSGVYQQGPSVVFYNAHSTEIDLVVSGDFATTSPPPGNTGGSSGGSSRGGSSSSSSSNIPVTTTVQNDTNETAGNATDDVEVMVETCEPNWICTQWQDCIAGKQKRTCTDTNACDVLDGKPAESQECELVLPDEETPFEEESFFNRITGAVVGGGTSTWVMGIGVLLIVGGLLGFVLTRKK